MKVTVYRPFYDLEEGVDRHAGEVFECTEERFNVIKSKLPAFVSGETTTTKKTTRKTTTRKTAKK